jgi:hypothetical protein
MALIEHPGMCCVLRSSITERFAIPGRIVYAPGRA